MTEVWFIDWLTMAFVPWNENRRRTFRYKGHIVFFLDGHATSIIDSVFTYAGSIRLLIIRLVAHSSHLSPPLDLDI
jgi:hypothetical protein